MIPAPHSTWFSRFVWPLQRRFVDLPARCSRCILSDRYTSIGSDGLCRYCRDYLPSQFADASSLHDLRRVLGSASGRHYDATLLLSGGKDSAWILYRLRNEYHKLRLLCLTIDNGFLAPTAIPNAQRAAQKLGADLLVVESVHERFQAAFRKAFLELKGLGCYGVVDFADGSLIFQVAAEVTQSLGIKTMISGLSWVQLQKITGSADVATEYDGLRLVHPLAAWRTDEQKIRRYVTRYDLLAPGSDDPLVSNGEHVLPMVVVDNKNLGYSSFEPEFAQLIREGKSDRNEWLPKFELLTYLSTGGHLDSHLEKFLNRLHLTTSEVL